MKIKRCILFLAILTMLFAFSGIVNANPNKNISVELDDNNPAAATIYKGFYDVPVLALNVNLTNNGSVGTYNLTNISVALIYTGTAAASDYALAVYNDSNHNSVADYGDQMILNYTPITAATGVNQILSFPSISTGNNKTISSGATAATGANQNITLLILARNESADHDDGDTFKLNVTVIWINYTQNNTHDDTGGRLDPSHSGLGNTFTISTVSPVLTVSAGTHQPAAQTKQTNARDFVIMHLNFSESNGVAQTIRHINLTPMGTMAPQTDTSEIRFYIDDDADGGFGASDDKRLATNLTDWAQDTIQGGTNFEFNGSIFVPANGQVSVLMVMKMATPSHGEFLLVNVTGNSSIRTGSSSFNSTITLYATPANGTFPIVTNNFSIDIIRPNLTAVETFDMNGDGYLDALNITFNETVYVRNISTAGGFNVTNSTNNFLNWSYYTGNLTNNNGSTKLTFIFNTSKTAYDTGDVFELIYNGSLLNISDDAGNEPAVTQEDPYVTNVTGFFVDRARPVIVFAQTFDADGNGYIDGYNITFSESINVTALGNYSTTTEYSLADNYSAAPNFTVSGYTNPIISLNITSATEGQNCSVDPTLNNSLCLWITPGSAPDTDAIPDLTVLASTIADNATGNYSSSQPFQGDGQPNNWMNAVTTGTVVENDTAAPVLMSAYTGSYNQEGVVNYVNFSFSEPMNFSTFYSNRTNSTHTAGILRFENNTVITGDEGAGLTAQLNFQFISDIGDSANSRNVYINFSGFSDPMKLNTSHRFEFNLSSALWDMNQTNMSKNVNAFSDLYITNDTVAPYVRHRYGCGYNSSGIPNQGYAINTTGCIMLEFTEPINHTISNASVAANNASITFTVTSNEALLINVLNLTPSATMSEANVTIWINVTDRANNTVGFANRRNITTSIMVDATPPTLTWVALNNSLRNASEGWVEDDDSRNDTLFLYFSENMTRADIDATSAADLLFKISDDKFTAWSAEAVDTYAGDGSTNNSRIVIVRLGGAVDVNARGIWNGSNSSGGADAVLLQPFSRAVTDLAGNNPSNSTGKLDIADAVVSFTPNQWTGFSVPYSLNSTMLDTRLSGLTTSIYTYNGTHWVLRTTSQLTPLEGYLVRINTSAINHVPINLLSIDTNNPVTPSSITLNNGWNLIAVDGKNGSTNTTEGRLCNTTSSSSWLNSLCTGTPVVQGAYAYEVGAGNSLTVKAVNSENIPALYVAPYNAYWVDIRSTTSAATAAFSGFGRW